MHSQAGQSVRSNLESDTLRVFSRVGFECRIFPVPFFGGVSKNWLLLYFEDLIVVFERWFINHLLTTTWSVGFHVWELRSRVSDSCYRRLLDFRGQGFHVFGLFVESYDFYGDTLRSPLFDHHWQFQVFLQWSPFVLVFSGYPCSLLFIVYARHSAAFWKKPAENHTHWLALWAGQQLRIWCRFFPNGFWFLLARLYTLRSCCWCCQTLLWQTRPFWRLVTVVAAASTTYFTSLITIQIFPQSNSIFDRNLTGCSWQGLLGSEWCFDDPVLFILWRLNLLDKKTSNIIVTFS